MSKEAPQESRTVINAQNPNRLDFVGSSNLVSATFDPEKRSIEVEMKGGKKYNYANFTPQKLGAWMQASSAGKWFSENVVKNTAEHPVVTPGSAPAETSAAPSADPPGLQPVTMEAVGTTTTDPAPLAPPPNAREREKNVTTPRFGVNFEDATAEDKARAQKAYEAYGENSKWLTFDGRRMPSWDALSTPVRSHWTASIAPLVREAVDARREAAASVAAAERAVDIAKGEVAHATDKLAKAPGQREHDRLQARITELEGNPAAARVATLDAEIDKVRAEKAALELENRNLKAQLAGRAED